MFYIKLFYKILIENLAFGVPFFILTNLLIIFGAQFHLSEKFAAKTFPSMKGGDYFYALIVKEENISWISRKIKTLPGVARCQPISEKEIEKELSIIMAEIGEDLKIDLNYGGLKITFADGIERRSKDLIREYLIRLVGREKVTLGPIKKIATVGEDSNRWLRTYFGYAVGTVLGILWIFTFVLIRRRFVEKAYLVKNYQRRKGVLPKTILLGLGSNLLLSVLVQIFIAPVDVYLLSAISVIMILIGLAMSRGEEWSV